MPWYNLIEMLIGAKNFDLYNKTIICYLTVVPHSPNLLLTDFHYLP